MRSGRTNERVARAWAGVVGAGALAASLAAAGLGQTRSDARPDDGPPAADAPGGDAATVRYSRDIRPILADRCFKCHGPDEAVRDETGGLRLDSFAGATADLGGGRRAIEPGDPGASEVVRRLRAHDPGDRMPPAESKLSVSEDEIRLIERWIAQGAEYEGHWAFETPVRPALPAVGDEAWCRNPIDRFVLARLEAEGISPSAEADRETLIRRVSLDLTGLPPSVEEIDAFLADDEPGAYGRVVDRLLASPHYGERMAVYWLDVARYADTNGYHHDNERHQWPWRDWVIESFNENVPFDRFVTAQLAGDLLPDAGLDEVVATGFCRNHPITAEGGAIEEEYLTEYAADRVETLSTALLGLTMQCARCHDHKYDPVTMEDYYGLFAFFNSITERGVPDYIQGRKDKAFAPFVAAPTDEQAAALASLEDAITAAEASVAAPIPGLDEAQASWEAGLRERHGVRWAEAEVAHASSGGGATMHTLEDGSVLASGENPDTDVHEIVLRTDAAGLRLIRIDALEDESLPGGRAGRAPNGNAVLTGVEVEAASVADPSRREAVPLAYAWADHEQPNGDFDALNVLEPDSREGWAINAHVIDRSRTLLLLAEEAFGFEGGTEVRIRLRYESVYEQHALGRVRLGLAAADGVRAALPTVWGDWFLAGPFEAETADRAFATAYGPEGVTRIDPGTAFGASGRRWAHLPDLVDGEAYGLSGERSAFYLGRTVFSPERREHELSLGSDDAIRVYLNGREVHANDTRRGVAPDQDSARVTLRPGENALVVKIVNDAGPGGVYFEARPTGEEPMGLAPLALVAREDRTPDGRAALDEAYRLERSPEYAARVETLSDRREQMSRLRDEVPNVMVMEEMDEARETYVLTRGAYDSPDRDRPVGRRTPTVLGAMDEDARRDRLGLARWLFEEDHPLTGRVAVNRLWQVVFGAGIVRTSEDFGLQGEWPSHPALLDWLAVKFRESGWDVKVMMRLIVTSATYRQSSAARPELEESDPENRLLARSPRRRLAAEMIRDNALAASGLLVREIGGPSVRPYQPAGLWKERAMLDSDTRIFERDDGGDLYRRGLYTFWKRSAPPPQMATFDAPEREFCVVRRGATSTPLQALVLLNDETYVEIARALAQRSMLEARWEEDPVGAIVRAFRLATGRRPGPGEVALLVRTYEDAAARYRATPEDASALLSYGASPVESSLDEAELAGMTVVCSVILNLDETITRD